MAVMSLSFRSLLLFCSLMWGLASGCAQHVQIAGRVTDETGKAIPRAMVSLTSSGYAVMTDQDGVFTIDHETGQAQGDQGRLTKKTYELLVEAKGYEKLTIPVDAQAGGRVWVGRHQIKPDQADVDPTKPVGEKEEESIRFDRGSGATVGY